MSQQKDLTKRATTIKHKSRAFLDIDPTETEKNNKPSLLTKLGFFALITTAGAGIAWNYGLLSKR